MIFEIQKQVRTGGPQWIAWMGFTIFVYTAKHPLLIIDAPFEVAGWHQK